jgi:glycosyltransferase involved in cell wall biosynthesis
LRPDVVHTNSLKAAYYGGLAARIVRIPVVSHVHDRLADDYLPERAARLTRRVLRAVPRAVVVPSQTVGATLGRPAEVIPNAVLPPRSMGPTGSARPLTIGMIGRIAPWKGQHVFVDAFAQAFPDGDERASVVGAPVFGSDEERYLDELHERAVAHGLNGRLRFEDFAHDVEPVLAGLDVLVHASVVPEPFGLVVLEGMAAGVPVVAAAAGGPAEIVTHGVDGLLYPPGDAEALAQTLRMLASDPALRLRLGDAARRRASEFAPEAVADRMCALYDEVLNGVRRNHASGRGVAA